MVPEYLYYFDLDADSDRSDGSDDERSPDDYELSLANRLRHAIFSGLAKICLVAMTLSAPLAAQTDTPVREAEPAPRARGVDTLKAQMNALQGGLPNLRKLRRYLGEAGLDDESVLARAQQLIESLPQHDEAGEAAWRIAAVASLTLKSGALANLSVDNGYRLARGSIGWDFGPEGSDVHAGFTPITPSALDSEIAPPAISGATAMTDGIVAVKSFNATLPNGLYRILIVRDAQIGTATEEEPFGGDIVINGAPIKSTGIMARDRRNLTGSDELIAANVQPAVRRKGLGLGVEGWAIVENGPLRVDFAALPEGRAITAIIAEPFEIDKVALEPVVAETLAEALGGIAPAAGPEPRATRRGPQFGRRGGGNAAQFGASNGSPNSGDTNPGRATRPIARSGAGNGFAANRRISSSTSAVAAADATQQEDAITGFESVSTGSETPLFKDREILVKRSAGPGPDSTGMAIDLGTSLDEANATGNFLCSSDSCDDLLPVAPEPDLGAAALLLGDWLDDPDTLSDSWGNLEAVLGARALGSETAIVYEFDVDSTGWTDVELRISAGSGSFVWLDGEYIFGASQAGAFVDDLDFEYRIELLDLTSGDHYLQILSESHIDDQGYALELRGTPVGSAKLAVTAVHEPGSVALLSAGLFGLGFLARRRRR